MAEYVVKVLEAHFITHDVKRFVVEKPAGYSFIPGQATDVSINLHGWRDKMHPFTFTGLNKWDYLEFMIKIYLGHNGVTHALSRVNEGAELILHDVFGAIQYKGRGTFIAAGAGITPFIAIFRELQRNKELKGNRLIFSNKTLADVIMGDELKQMFGDDLINVITREHTIGFLTRRINREFLIEHVVDFGQYFYVCGPDKFVTDVKNELFDLGANPEYLVIEQ